jgi:hemoglobin
MTETQIRQLVDQFYSRAREDEVLSSLFNAAVDDWPEHLERLADFWSSVMLSSGRYKGSPVAAHRRHGGVITSAMFDRWLQLWRQTAREALSTEDAEAVIGKAERIAESLQLALFVKFDPQRAAA